MRATAIAPAGSFVPADTIVLDREDRHRRRMAMTGEGGLSFVLDLADVAVLEDGDGLVLEDGRVVLVRAAEEDVVTITAASQAELVRIAWHLGNRHLPTELQPGRLVIRRDHVIEAMVEGLGGHLSFGRAAFRPEGGAYGPGAVHGHDHPHAHGAGDDGHHHDRHDHHDQNDQSAHSHHQHADAHSDAALQHADVHGHHPAGHGHSHHHLHDGEHHHHDHHGHGDEHHGHGAPRGGTGDDAHRG